MAEDFVGFGGRGYRGYSAPTGMGRGKTTSPRSTGYGLGQISRGGGRNAKNTNRGRGGGRM